MLLGRALRRRPPAASLLRRLATSSSAGDFYSLLGVKPDADAEQIKAAYRREALKWHPDRHAEKEKAAAEERFKLLSQAYQVLSSPDERRAYDARRSFGGGFAQQQQERQQWGGSAGAYEWQRQQQQQWQRRPPSESMSRAEAEAARELFNRLFGGASVVDDMLRRAAAAQASGRAEEILETLLRSASRTGMSETTQVFVTPSGERILRRTRSFRAPDGRLVREVEETSIGAGGWRGAQQSPSSVGGRAMQGGLSSVAQAMRAVAAPFFGALLANIAQGIGSLLFRMASAVLRAIVRRIFGR